MAVAFATGIDEEQAATAVVVGVAVAARARGLPVKEAATDRRLVRANGLAAQLQKVPFPLVGRPTEAVAVAMAMAAVRQLAAAD